MDRDQILVGAKLALNIIGGIGVSFLCSALAGNVASACNAGPVKKTFIAIGGALIGGMAAQQAEKCINEQVDAVVDSFDKMKTFVDKQTAKK